MVILEKDDYPNSPVVEVAWEIRFPDSFKLTLEKIKNEFIPNLIDLYPNVVPMNDAGFEISDPFLKTAKIKPFSQKIIGYELTDAGKKNFIKIFHSNLIVNTREHSNFSEFKIALITVMNAFVTVFDEEPLIEIARIGLRYINVCELPENNKNRTSEYLVLPIDFDRFPIKTIGNFRYEIIQHLEDISFHSIYSGIIVEKLSRVLMDLDAFSTNNEKIDDPTKWIEYIIQKTIKMHKIIKSNFQDSITEAFISNVMERI